MNEKQQMEHVSKAFWKKVASTGDRIEVKMFITPQDDPELFNLLAKYSDRDVLVGFEFPQIELDIE
jgi:hypothetical protein